MEGVGLIPIHMLRVVAEVGQMQPQELEALLLMEVVAGEMVAMVRQTLFLVPL
jgi:hypothetical protein